MIIYNRTEYKALSQQKYSKEKKSTTGRIVEITRMGNKS